MGHIREHSFILWDRIIAAVDETVLGAAKKLVSIVLVIAAAHTGFHRGEQKGSLIGMSLCGNTAPQGLCQKRTVTRKTIADSTLSPLPPTPLWPRSEACPLYNTAVGVSHVFRECRSGRSDTSTPLRATLQGPVMLFLGSRPSTAIPAAVNSPPRLWRSPP